MPFNPQRVDDRNTDLHRSYATVIGLKDSLLVTRMDDGSEQTHSLAEQSRVVRGGRPFSPTNITAGARVMITTRIADRGIASEVECMRHPGSS